MVGRASWMRVVAIIISCTWLVAGCGQDGGVITAPDVPDVVDLWEEPPPDVVAEDAAPDLRFDLAQDVAEVDFGLEPDPGAPGNACESNEECNSGFCILTPDGRQCTLECLDECPFGWECVLHQPSLPDEVYICAPSSMTLCRPCGHNDDCLVNGADTGDHCVSYGGAGFFCGAACDGDGDCPPGYACQEVTDVAGGPEQQCVRTEGECECAQSFVEDGAWTDCHVENDHGLCMGERQCTVLGLSACDAPVPAPEACNLEDDDCDGDVDEGTGGGECHNINSWGACPGIEVCVNGELLCQGDKAQAELCNGEDDDCDGEADEGFPDTDKDGVADCLEGDKDGDGIADPEDNCPYKHNPSQADFDLDTLGDACDPDDDNDLSADEEDCAPKDPASHPGADETCDGKDNDCDGIVDQGFPDADADGIKNCVDPDDDNDTFADGLDCAPLDGSVFPTAPEKCDGKDNDCDNVVDEDFADLDGDGVADCVDSDLDGDGVDDAADNCPKTSNPQQEDFDADGFGDACDTDDDGDGIPDNLDNCLLLFNPGQPDTDKDGKGDGCDEDDDGDGAADGADNCPLVANPGQADFDGDGLGDACDEDDDNDGDPDVSDCAPLDPAVHHGADELCNGQDDNCVFGEDEGFNDNDLDGLKNCIDPDDDNDGDPDETDCAPLDPAQGSGATESCDGKDNDCDGQVDEGLGQVKCGKGICAHSQDKCVDGVMVVCDPWEGAEPEGCNGLDDDCDGLVDEDQGTTGCGLGVCWHTVANCVDGVPQECDPIQGASDEVCDGLDNDCDGKIDEELPTLACGKGLCFHTHASCIGGVEQLCDPFLGAKPESCNGIDDDCDGVEDEGLGTTTCGLGECEHTVDNCVDGQLQVCNPFTCAQLETCDTKDNDCDGLVDEELGTISCGLGICMHTVQNCVDGQPQVCDPKEGASPQEECDGEDDDCDGQVDEGFGPVSCGKGVCAVTVESCIDGVPQACVPGEPGDETCNGLDDDCNGVVDDGYPDFDEDGLADCVDEDDDNDTDPDLTDCAPYDAEHSSLSGISCTLLVTNGGSGVLADYPVKVDVAAYVAEYGNQFTVLTEAGDALPYCFEQASGECAASPSSGAVWVKVDTLPAVETVTLRLIAGGGDQGVAGTEIFELYDDFSAPAIDGNVWTTDTTNCNPSVSNGWLVSSNEKGSNSHCGVLAKSFEIGDDMRFTTRLKLGSGGGSDCDPGVILTGNLIGQDNTWVQTHAAGWVSDDETPQQYMLHYSTDMETIGTVGIRGQTFLVHVTVSDGKVRACQSIGDKCSSWFNYNPAYARPFVGALWYQSIPWSYDWVQVRKLATPEPTTAWQ